jgi:hypothetical protein
MQNSEDYCGCANGELTCSSCLQDPIAYDTVEALNQIFEPINAIFEERLADSEKTSEAAKFFYDQYFSELFALYKRHADGIIKGQRPDRSPVRLPVNV